MEGKTFAHHPKRLLWKEKLLHGILNVYCGRKNFCTASATFIVEGKSFAQHPQRFGRHSKFWNGVRKLYYAVPKFRTPS